MRNADRMRRRSNPLTPGLTAGLLAGVALNAAGMVWLGATWRFPTPPPMERIFVSVGADTPRAREFAELNDPSPLFLPTKLNHGSGSIRIENGTENPPVSERETGLPTRQPRTSGIGTATPALTPEGAEKAAIPDTFAGLGMRPARAPRAARSRCEITEEVTGKAVEIGTIAIRRDSRALPPAEFIVDIDAYGVQSPTLLSGTGDPELDIALNSALKSALHEKTPPQGRYKVTLAP